MSPRTTFYKMSPSITKMFFLLMVVHFQHQLGAALHMDIVKYKNHVNVSCVSNRTEEVITIQIAKENHKPLVFLRQPAKVYFGDGMKNDFEAEGKISKHEPDYLKLTLTNPGLDDIGRYVCSLFYVNVEGKLSEARSSAEIITEDIGIVGLIISMNKTINQQEKQLTHMKHQLENQKGQVSILEEASKSHGQGIQDLRETSKTERQYIQELKKTSKTQLQNIQELKKTSKTEHQYIQELKKTSKTQLQNIQELEEKGQVCAFTAFYKATDTIKVNKVLLFSNVYVNLGNAYNSKTGMFTAPRAGLYAITLTITMETTGDQVGAIIYVNHREVGKIYACDVKSPGDQSSFSLALKLSKGDKVYSVVHFTNTKVLEDYKYYSVFSGFLVNAL